MHPAPIKSRYDPTPVIVVCMIRVFRDGKWYEHIYEGTVDRGEEVIKRLVRKGRRVRVAWEWDEYYTEIGDEDAKEES